MLQEANGGYLFLDEVHRLSSENQEKLFSFIDSGRFYKMGDNVHPKSQKSD
ncbi:sigma 54-interacting transcriptional regulator [Lactobacillus sp. R2/2]|nr:sigma 54-interacting transcriptional regulator [Lactobacillus sp. R2/2]